MVLVIGVASPLSRLALPALAPERLFRHGSPQPLRAEEVAFLDLVSCEARDGFEAASAIYEAHGVVRVLGATGDADAVVRQGTAAGVLADAFGQASRDQGRKRVIQRRFNVGVLEAIPKRKASML